ncbi:putative membrane protein [Amycolatopsis arida]|uniref:Putative membrane protein n=1 Tax=Amycolatopsis arida TaxID=587909 RepID=A0A1I5L543_9PSEU|nr:DUF202 domain-containing protein [Amycolatopsis arida]TDX93574.1 putative membrane protein [Amycolatopsis arida]SFO91986.1 putative membrane protein [Amycolatopsis arida]
MTTAEPENTAEPDNTAEPEPDYRFTLANERTFLAWLRTALGLVAGGVAVHQLVPGWSVPGARTALAALALALATVLAAASYPRWRRVQRAMRRGEPLPSSPLVPVLAVGVLVITLFAAVLVLVG